MRLKNSTIFIQKVTIVLFGILFSICTHASTSGCFLYVDLSPVENAFENNGTEKVIESAAQGKGYSIIPYVEPSYRYGRSYDDSNKNNNSSGPQPSDANFRLVVIESWEDSRFSRVNAAELGMTLSRDSTSVWRRSTKGSVYCQGFQGWTGYYDRLSENWITPITGTYETIAGWLSRCDGTKSINQFVSDRMIELISKYIKSLPDCQSAKTLPELPPAPPN